MIHRIAVPWALFTVLGAAALSAQELPLELPPRAPSEVMSFQGAGWLERPERVAEETPEEVLDVLGFADGDVVADLGAGSGFYTRRIARLVAPGGSVYAVDIQPEMLEILREGVADEGLTNVVPVLGEVDDPRLPAGGVDWIFLADVYHEFGEPEAMLARMREALRDDGRVALLEYRVEDGTGDHIRASHRMSVRQVLDEWLPAGFRLLELREFLPSQHLFVFGRDPGSGDRPSIRHHDLLDAIASGLVTVTARGGGPRSIEMTVTRAIPDPLVVTFPAGTYFASADGASDMVARRDGMVVLTQAESRAWPVQARRVSPTDPVPGPDRRLTVESADDHRPGRNVMWVFQGLDFPADIAPLLEELTLWIAASDAGYEELAAQLAGIPLPAANGVVLALAYAENAGIDPTATRVWRERERFLGEVSESSLRGLIDEWEGR